VQQSLDGGQTWTFGEDVPGSVSACVRTGLQPNRTYTFRVFAVNGYGRSDPSNWTSATTPRGTPPAPGGLTARATSPTAVALTWSAVAGVSHYRIYQSTDGGASYQFGEDVPGTTTGATRDGLTPNRTYTFVVTAVNGYGESDRSAPASATTPKASVPAPTGLRVLSVSTTYVVIAWVEVSGESHYRVEISRDNVSWSFKEDVPANHAYSAQLDGLTRGTRYYVRVMAVDGAGRRTDPSNVLTFVTRSTAALTAQPVDGAVPPIQPSDVIVPVVVGGRTVPAVRPLARVAPTRLVFYSGSALHADVRPVTSASPNLTAASAGVAPIFGSRRIVPQRRLWDVLD
jgi:hypothetical protein